jgi:RimJ/RimL family protein N-acetyltransferase
MSSFPDPIEPLHGDRVSLRLAAERDIPEILIAHQDDPELYERLGMERPPSGAELGRRSDGEESERREGLGVHFSILEPGRDVCRGQIDVHHLEWLDGRAELGIWVAPAARGRGIAREALRLASGWLFSACGLARVELLTEPENTAMIASARAAGFAAEGTLRAYARERGRRIDLAVMSLLPSDLGVLPSGRGLA